MEQRKEGIKKRGEGKGKSLEHEYAGEVYFNSDARGGAKAVRKRAHPSPQRIFSRGSERETVLFLSATAQAPHGQANDRQVSLIC